MTLAEHEPANVMRLALVSAPENSQLRRIFAQIACWRRPVGLLVLALILLAGYLAIRPLSIGALVHPAGVAIVELAMAIPYGAAAWWVIGGQPPVERRVRIAEWVIVLGAAVGFFALVFPLWPSLSGDAYRYVWDGRVTAHGFNPLVLAPESPLLTRLRDAVIYPRLYWIHVPTIYPPAAQALYFCAYLAAPDNVWAIKAEMVAGVALVAALLVVLLRARRQEPLRVLLWLWCPLVVVEFGLDGHVDAIAIAAWLAALVVNERFADLRSRLAVGVLLGIATLTKLYPALFLLALGRRSDRALYVAFAGTIVVGYLPFLHNGVPALGFLGIYAGETQSYGALLFWLRKAFVMAGLPATGVQVVVGIAAAIAVCAVSWARWRGRISEPTALYLLLVLWLLLTPHLQPWYVTALAPLCALYMRPPGRSLGSGLTSALGVGVCTMPAFDVAFDSAYRSLEWLYAAIYIIVAIGAVSAFAHHWWRRRHMATEHAEPVLALDTASTSVLDHQ
jgi:glycosyl transferase family 87